VFPVEARLSAYYIDGQKLHLGLVRDTTERKRAEEALRQKEYLLSESQRIAHIGSWVYDPADPAGGIKWSDELYRIHGLSPETFTPTVESFLSLLVPEDRPAMQNWIAACAAGENAGDLEFRVRLPDGSIRVLMGRGELQRDSENNPTLMTGTSQDITDRKRAEDALRESEEQFQAMANGIPQLASMSNADGTVVWYNRRWYEYTGTTPEQMHGWGWQIVHDPETLPSVLERWRASIASGEPFDMEFPLRGADGIFRMFLTRVMPLKNAEGRVVQWFGTNTDISELKEVEKRLATQAEQLARSGQALEAQTAMLNLVLESMGEGLVAADREGRFLLWNRSASKLLSCGSTALPPEQWSSHYACYQPDGITPCPMDQLPLVRATQGESLQKELIIRRAGSEDSAILEFSGRPMKDARGNLCGGVVAFRDITQRKKDEWEIRKLNEELEMKVQQRTAQLEAANHELEAFTYSVSHDLRAPLRHISSFSSILREDFGTAMDAEARRLLERIENGARRMTLLVDGLLSLARFGRQALNISLTELNAIVDGVVSVLQTEYTGRDVEWRIAPLPALECDPILIQQVFQNLLANALKYSSRRDKAVIEIDSIQQTGNPPVIFVRDNGAGFSMQHAEKLFGVFQRMHSDAEFEGTGVGLATVNRIIQRHGGRIWAEAEVDRGATFYFTVAERDLAGSTRRATFKGALEHEHEHRD
jgi:PAS domain S-box-containing protein